MADPRSAIIDIQVFVYKKLTYLMVNSPLLLPLQY